MTSPPMIRAILMLGYGEELAPLARERRSAGVVVLVREQHRVLAEPASA